MQTDYSKKLYFYTNTKLFKNLEESLSYLQQLQQLLADISPEQMELGLMPPYTALYAARRLLHSGTILLGAQNVCGENGMELTGEISARMLKELGTELVMVGHSERRRVFAEQDAQINRKVRFVLEQEMIALLSISETGADRNSRTAAETLRMQLRCGLRDVPQRQAGLLRILYEPAWAVGNAGITAEPEYVEKQHQVIRACLLELFGSEAGMRIPVIYGGSVSAENALALISQPHIDGLGIGRNAWDAVNFNRIIRMVIRHESENDRNSSAGQTGKEPYLCREY